MFLFMLATDINVALRWPAFIQLFCSDIQLLHLLGGFAIASGSSSYEASVLFLVWH